MESETKRFRDEAMKAQVEMDSDLIVRTTLRATRQRIGFERPTGGPFVERGVDGVTGPWGLLDQPGNGTGEVSP